MCVIFRAGHPLKGFDSTVKFSAEIPLKTNFISFMVVFWNYCAFCKQRYVITLVLMYKGFMLEKYFELFVLSLLKELNYFKFESLHTKRNFSITDFFIKYAENWGFAIIYQIYSQWKLYFFSSLSYFDWFLKSG